MFVSNFSFCNNFYSFKEILKRKEKEGYYKRSPNLKKYEIDYYIYQQKTLTKFVNLIRKFATRFPKRRIIIRPHPTERSIFWINHFNKFQNVKIEEKGNLSKYIVNSECVIQSGCTSAVEAFVSEIPLVNYVPIKSKKKHIRHFCRKICN